MPTTSLPTSAPTSRETPPPIQFSAFMAMSLDGFIAREDGRLDWLYEFNEGEDDYGYGAFLDSVDVIVLGKRSYQKVLTFHPWPYEGKRVMVLGQQDADDENLNHSEFFSGALADLSEHLKGATRIYVDGGKTVCNFIQQGLLSDLTLTLLPLTLGAGLPLFTGVAARFKLQQCRSFENGLVQVQYLLKP